MSFKENSEFWEIENSSIEAREVYAVMQNDYRISRNIRAQWFFKNLNKSITFTWKTCQEECSNEIEIISAIPKCSEKFQVDSKDNSSTIKLVADTKLNFLSTQYRLVFCLDLSSSVSTVDIQHDNIYFEEIFTSLEQTLRSISQPFFVPGSKYMFMPQVYITVIAHIPNCSDAAPQVLIQGWILTQSNVQQLLDFLQNRLKYMCKLVEKLSSAVHEEQIQFMMPHDASGSIVDGTIDGNKMIKKVLDLSADISTLKLIRYGILALQLLPENSSAGIVVITDGVINFPNHKSLDSLLTQLRNSTIACYFLQIGSPFHAFSCFGRIQYKEIMEFIATATCGAYFPACKYKTNQKTDCYEINAYQRALLFWNFQRDATTCILEAYEPSSNKENYWHVDNPHFYTVAHQSRVRKKHTEGTYKVSLENLLSCRLREGYSVKSVSFDEAKNTAEIRLVLPWMLSTNIEYIISSGPGRQWKSNSTDIPSCHFEVIVDGCYEFLHDVTCSDKKPIRSFYRKTVIAQFWSYIKNLSNTDQILSQLHSFALVPIYYTIPESIKNGVPLFYFPATSSMPALLSKNLANMQFTTFWKPLCMLDINVWQKWMHAHRIGVILQHDIPLQKNLHLPNASGRYTHVPCRQATTSLNSLLREESSFVLVENHSYIKLLFDDPDKPPVSFYVIRVTSKPPCVVIRLAFLGGLPGLQRYEIVNDLREKILNLKLAKRSTPKDYSQSSSKQLQCTSDSSCCHILKKPVEKILIRYEKLPTNFLISATDSQNSSRNIPFYQKHSDAILVADPLATLSQYLLQQRWIWSLQYESYVSLDLKSASKILFALTNLRLQEGFHFTHSSLGIIYMVQEIPVEILKEKTTSSGLRMEKENNCCIVQYIIFPPHCNTTVKDSISEEDDTEVTEADGELQLITECWIEPQYGLTTLPPKLDYLNGLKFDQLPNAIHQKDLDIVKVLTTFEHLCTMCHRRRSTSQLLPQQSLPDGDAHPSASLQLPNISVLPICEQLEQANPSMVSYAFNLMSLLAKCPQIEMTFSTLHDVQSIQNEVRFIGNDTFFQYLVTNLKYFHDQEIDLTLEDCAVFLLQIQHRDCDIPSPNINLPHPEFTFSSLSKRKQTFVNISDCDRCAKCEQFIDSAQPMTDAMKDSIPKWRCFVKGSSASHFILTLVPASYSDLKKLHKKIAAGIPAENPPEACNTEDEDPLNDGKPEKDGDNRGEADVSYEKSLILPIYVYNCVSVNILNHLVQLEPCSKIVSIHESHAYECECCQQSRCNKGDSVLDRDSEESVSAVETPKKTIDAIVLKEHCLLMEKAYSKAFVYGAYRSLMNGINIHESDAIAAIDNICEESLLEVDITEFVYMVCGHIKDFFTKRSVRQMHLSQESNNEDNSKNQETEEEENTIHEKCSEKYFPLSNLQKYQPCEELHQKHLSIKEKFADIIKSFFKPISSRPDYYYFCPMEEESENDSIINAMEESQEEDALSENVVPFEDESNEPDKRNNLCEEDASSKSCLNTNSSVSSIDKDTDLSITQDKNTYPPLMVHFSCSVRKSKQDIESCPLTSLPTCLNDIIACLDQESNLISLDDLKITLDIYCLTVPSDVESPDILRRRVYSTSYSSSSPVPEAESYQRQDVKDNENESNCSDIPTDTLLAVSLVNLTSLQLEAVMRCTEKVKWLLQDEKASVSLNCFPVTSDVLNMIVSHVKVSTDKPCCIIKEVPLVFVYGPDNSLAKFIQAFKRMSRTGYRLEEVENQYYLVVDTDAEQKTNLEGSIEISQFDLLKRVPYSDDCTELKRIMEGIKETEKISDSRVSKEENEVFNLTKEKRDHDHPDEDSETEDGLQERPKAKFRKISAKRLTGLGPDGKRSQVKLSLWETERKAKSSSKLVTSQGSNSMEDETDKHLNKDQHLNLEMPNLIMGESSPEVSFDPKLQSTSPSLSKIKTSDSDDPTAGYSEKFHASNTEDGYDGDSSDNGSDLDWINSLEHTRRPVLPKFWLIMNIQESKVIVYFHMRNTTEDDPELVEGKSVLQDVIQIVARLCKEVNQILLLQSLSESRMCNRLLVPEGNEDMWKGRDLNRVSCEDSDFILEVQEKYLEATLKFEPGFFGCPVAWVTHFRLHHRLAGSSAGSHKSNGMQALRSILSTFSVNNRENMFVYQENSGRVFYLRLFEMHCDIDHQRPDDNLSLLERCSSLQSLPVKSNYTEFEIENDFRPRVNSGASDGYRQDNISTSSSRKHQKCVALFVHGIGEVGIDIQKDLVQVLQNRLNEGVLDQINMMLARNPLCMLTPEDVLFIQDKNCPPSHELYYTLPVKLLGHAHAIHIYLRHNLLHFLYNPKYTDNKKETHFKAYWHCPMEWTQVNANDAFLYHVQQAVGRPCGKGIACIILSLVTGQNRPFQILENLPPNPSAYQDGLSESEFDDLTSTSAYTLKKDRSPGPVALVRFQIWHVGKDNVDCIEVRLQNAVKHALWDLLLEYRALTSPTSDASFTEDPACYSEPTTPIRMRRSGVVNLESHIQIKDIPSSVKLHSLKEMSTSVPDINSKAHTSSPLLKDIPAFKYGNKPQSAKPEFASPVSTQSAQNQGPVPAATCDKENLNSTFNATMKAILEYGEKLGCPTLSRFDLKLPSRHATNFILKELIKIMKSVLKDMIPKVYIETEDSTSSDVEFVAFDPLESINSIDREENKPGSTRHFIIVARNERQWRAYMGLHDFCKFQESGMEVIKTYQRHMHHICEPKSGDSYPASIPSSPTSVNKSTSSAASTSPNPKSPNPYATETQASNQPSFVPRQRFLLMYIQDKEAILYLYNFTSDTTQSIHQQFVRLTKWHHHRNSLLNNVVLQKLGVFHGLTSLYRSDVEKPKDSMDTKSGNLKEVEEPVPATFGYVEQLIRHHTFISKDTIMKSTSLSGKSAYISLVKSLKNVRPLVPFHLSSSANIRDPVTAHGSQFLETITSKRKDLKALYNMWQTRGSSVVYPFDKVFQELKRLARLSSYCFTPILFSPSWRYKVAPIRDHALEPLDQITGLVERLPEIPTSGRSRHSSGSSLKNSDVAGSVSSATRTRRVSGAAGYPGSNQGSPKMRTKTPSEEAWHTTVCHHYLQEYIQYLNNVGFVSLQTSENTDKSRHSAASDDDRTSRSDSFSRHRNSIRGAPYYLIKCLLGGLLVFELGMNDPYAYGHIYSVECLRFSTCSPRTMSNQFTAAFLDELDKVKLNINLHSFTYDYHLRTIHSYISGRQLIFRHGYHLTSFLDDFIKYYQKVPIGSRNCVLSGTLTISDVNMSGNQLYNYIISHNKLYGMTVLRMVPIMLDSNSSMDTEFALVELSAQKASYKDINDICQMGSFDVGILINYNTSEPAIDMNALNLSFYIILTSQRDLYPELSSFGTTLGSFQTVRFGSALSSSGFSSRKTSTITVISEKEKLESSGEESVHSTDSKSSSRSKKVSVVRGMCDEEIMYLGYYSSQETMMQQVLNKQAEIVRTHLQNVVQKASVHCRRDFLWSSLLPRTLKEENSSRDHGLATATSYAEFAELLDFVSRIPLNEIDEKLTPFMNMHISWYSTLAPVLRSKYADSHREFISPEGNSLYVIVTNSKCPDSFMLLTIETKTNRTDLCLVFREQPTDIDHTMEKPSQRILALQSLVEGFVNACCFHLWTCILPM